MRRQPRRRRASLWAGVYVGLFGAPGDDDRSDAAEPTDERNATEERDGA